MTDIGISCGKSTYTRDAGSFMTCKDGLEKQAGVCYEPCPAGLNGVGPVCWGNCPEGTSQCGALCLAEGTTCSKYVLNNGLNWVKLISQSAIGDVRGAVSSAATVALDYAYPICRGFNEKVSES